MGEKKDKTSVVVETVTWKSKKVEKKTFELVKRKHTQRNEKRVSEIEGMYWDFWTRFSYQ